jgi:hypothetical protein
VAWITNNFWRYGAIGRRLNGIRDSEIYQGAANVIRNFYITEVGNLTAGKQYSTQEDFFTEEVLDLTSTEYDFNIILTPTKLQTVNKSDLSVISELEHGLTDVSTETKTTLFKTQYMVSTDTTVKYFGISEDGLIGTSNYLDTLKLPIKNPVDIVLEIYKVIKLSDGELRPSLVATFENPIVIVETNLGPDFHQITLADTGLNINRLYKVYRTGLTKDDFSNIKEGEVYAIFKNYKEPDEDNKYITNNIYNEFVMETDDPAYGSSYFQGMKYQSLEKGTLTFGELIDFKSEIVDSCVFQNRYVITTKDTLYFSKTFDWNDFRNNTGSDDPFYIRPSVIHNNQPNILKLEADAGIWALTDRGIFSIGYNQNMTPSTSVNSIRIATDRPSTTKSLILGRVLYYIDTQNILRAIQPFYSTGSLDFLDSIVEKYDIDNRVKDLTIGMVNEKWSLIVSTYTDYILVYDILEPNLFRKIELQLPHTQKVIGIGTNFISGTSLHTITDLNYEYCLLTILPPAFSTKKGGRSLNDFESRIKRVVLNILNQDREAVKTILVNGQKINNLGQNLSDIFSLYKLETSFPILDGFDIMIITEQNNKTLELRSVETNYEVNSN